MKYVIDGYNLLHASPLIQAGSGPKWLEKQRFRLLQTLAALLPSTDRTETVVVFDARECPKTIPSEYEFEGIAVRFARDHDEADDLIEELIAAHGSASSLTVVSSDTRLQKAAKRRKAAFCNSRTWFDSLQASKPARTDESNSSDPENQKDGKLDAKEVAEWIAKMGTELTTDSPIKKKRR
jgi:uncharacterized protein